MHHLPDGRPASFHLTPTLTALMPPFHQLNRSRTLGHAQGRVAILKVHSKGKKLAKGLDLVKVARRTPGMTGADLQNLMNEAAILTARRKEDEISLNVIEDALEKIIAGPEKKGSVINERKKRLVAYHEVCGHALTVWGVGCAVSLSLGVGLVVGRVCRRQVSCCSTVA